MPHKKIYIFFYSFSFARFSLKILYSLKIEKNWIIYFQLKFNNLWLLKYMRNIIYEFLSNFFIDLKFRKSNILYSRIAITLMKFYMLYKMTIFEQFYFFSIYEADILQNLATWWTVILTHLLRSHDTITIFSTDISVAHWSIHKKNSDWIRFVSKDKERRKKSPLRSSRETLRLLFVASQAEYHSLRDIFTRTRKRMCEWDLFWKAKVIF